ncbi:MAG: hypothetical protein S4CHLAM2_16380 [Chlamydiales bacterium]|nr:hypothetical protein [Chlamydiales bacterium]
MTTTDNYQLCIREANLFDRCPQARVATCLFAIATLIAVGVLIQHYTGFLNHDLHTLMGTCILPVAGTLISARILCSLCNHLDDRQKIDFANVGHIEFLNDVKESNGGQNESSSQ